MEPNTTTNNKAGWLIGIGIVLIIACVAWYVMMNHDGDRSRVENTQNTTGEVSPEASPVAQASPTTAAKTYTLADVAKHNTESS